MVCPPAVAASFDSVDLIPWEASSVEVMRRSPDGDNCFVVVVVADSSSVEGSVQVWSSLLSLLLHPSFGLVVASGAESSAETTTAIIFIGDRSSSTEESSIDAAMMSHTNVVRGAVFRLIVVVLWRIVAALDLWIRILWTRRFGPRRVTNANHQFISRTPLCKYLYR